MGPDQSAALRGNLSPDDVEKFSKKSGFTPSQVAQLSEKYRKLAGSLLADERIDKDEFIRSMNITNRKIGSIIYDIIDKNRDSNIDFHEFVMGLSVFLPQTPFEDKVRMCFKAYDRDHGGTISFEEIKDMISLSLENNPFIEMTESQMNQLVTDLISQYDKTGNGELTFDSFYQMVRKAPGIVESFDLHVDEVFE